MKILVINTGSSSIKYQLFNMDNQAVLCHGIVERIGEETGKLTHEVFSRDGKPVTTTYDGFISDHETGFSKIVGCLMNQDFGVVKDRKEITAVGHRVVHGGETFKKPTVIKEKTCAFLGTLLCTRGIIILSSMVEESLNLL